MLHNKYGVAAVTQLLKRFNKTLVIPLMQPDTGFVKDIEHIDQLGAYLRGQTYALFFTARKRFGGSVEREVIESHLKHKAEACTYLLKDFRCNGLLTFAEPFLHRTGPLIEVLNIHRCQFINIFTINAEIQCLSVQTGAPALGTNPGHGKLVNPFLFGSTQISLLLKGTHIFDYTLVLQKDRIGFTIYSGYLHLYPLVAAVQKLINEIIGHL